VGNAMNPQFTQDVSAHLRLFNVGGSFFMLSTLGIITTVIFIVIALEKSEKNKTLQAFIYCFAAAATLLLSMSFLK
jgi:hypothetical protein